MVGTLKVKCLCVCLHVYVCDMSIYPCRVVGCYFIPFIDGKIILMHYKQGTKSDDSCTLICFLFYHLKSNRNLSLSGISKGASI